MPYPLYQIEFLAEEEADPSPESRPMALFLSLSPPKGNTYHIAGNIWEGFCFLISDDRSPADSTDYVPEATLLVGYVDETDVARFEDLCRSAKVPGRQMAGFRRVEPGKPLENDRTWVAEVVQRCKAAGLVK